MLEQVERYKGLELYARQVVEGFITGLHRSPFHGFSVEFAEHRQYNTGESTRNIDWRLYARTDRLYVKRYEEETNLRCQLIIDQSGSMLFPVEGMNNLEHPNKLTFAVYGAAMLVELLQRQRDAFGLTLLSDGIDLQTETRSNAAHKHHIYSILDSLLTTDHKSESSARGTSFVEALHLTAESLHRRSMVVLFTDAFIKQDDWDALLDALRHLRHNKHEVLLFHTYDEAKELNLAFDNRPTEFIDLETHRKLRLNPSELAESYAAEMRRRRDALKQKTIQYGIDYVPVAVENGFEQVMIPYLLKRSKHF